MYEEPRANWSPGRFSCANTPREQHKTDDIIQFNYRFMHGKVDAAWQRNPDHIDKIKKQQGTKVFFDKENVHTDALLKRSNPYRY